MRILYVAKHGSGDNEDEDAIAFSLRKLGHQVTCIQELARKRFPDDPKPWEYTRDDFDFCLFHKWEHFGEIEQMKIPLVFWHFDLISSTDYSLQARSQTRIAWMNRLVPRSLVGFCTDGDWVLKDTSGKLVQLCQGADERVAGIGTIKLEESVAPIIFTGMIHHGQKRVEFIEEMRLLYGTDFEVIGNGGAGKRIHGRELANIFNSTKIVVAPDGPNTDNYWSNRVWLTLSLGGFLLHPYCAKLEPMYAPTELITYRSRKELHALIEHYLNPNNEWSRQATRQLGFNRTMSAHTYTHRCMDLIRIVQERL